MTPGARERQAVPLSYIVKFGLNVVCDREKKQIYVKGKRSLALAKWIFVNAQPVRGDERIIFVLTRNMT